MKRLPVFVVALVTASALLCSCTPSDEFTDGENLAKDYTRNPDSSVSFNYSDGADSAPADYNVYSSSVSNFELRLFRNYYAENKSDKKSLVFSPSGTALELALLANGAGRDTKNEITSALGKDLTSDDLNECSSYFYSRITEVANNQNAQRDSLSGEESENEQLVRFENSFFFNDTSDIRSAFLQTNTTYYSLGIYRFLYESENSLAKVNSLFSYYCEDAFSSLDTSDTAFAASACDISDLWLDAYTQDDIEQGSFAFDGGTREASYLVSNETKLQSDRATGVMKYTKSTPLKLMLVMPDEGISIDEYVSDFDYLEFSTLLESFDITKKVTAKIPEFSIDGGSVEPLSATLSKSGLPTLFTDDADFSAMTHTDDFKINEIYGITPEFSLSAEGVGGIKQNDSVTLAKSRVTELDKTEETVEFSRPFIFLLLDNESNIPVYIGAVNS